MIVGENGAGKSTLLKIIMGLVYPTSGVINLNNQRIGYVPEKITIPKLISITKFLKVMKELKQGSDDEIASYLAYWDIEKAKDKRLGELSKGMLQKVIIIQAFLGNPDVLIFDEALNGLDSTMQKKLIELIKQENKKSKISLITSHYQAFYDEVIDKTISIRNGKLWEK